MFLVFHLVVLWFLLVCFCLLSAKVACAWNPLVRFGCGPVLLWPVQQADRPGASWPSVGTVGLRHLLAQQLATWDLVTAWGSCGKLVLVTLLES